ncbi:MAG: hypothetical protein R3F49_11750 [Planctomycetota bacterium]
MLRLSIVVLTVLVGALVAPAPAQSTYYQSSAGASDAQRIATDMLNDAASGRFRTPSFSGPNNPFDELIAQREARQRAREQQWAADVAAAREQANEAARARAWEAYEARVRRADSIAARYAELTARVQQLDAEAALESAWILERGEVGRGDVLLVGSPEERLFDVLRAAAYLGLDLGLIAFYSNEEGDSPTLAALCDDLARDAGPDARRARLWGHARSGHVGALLLLGGWYAGRDVRLGAQPSPLSGCADARASAVLCFERACARHEYLAGAWLAAVLLGPGSDAAERARGRELLERLLQDPEGPDHPAEVVLALHLLRADDGAAPERALALLGAAAQANWFPALEVLAEVHLDGLAGRFAPLEAAEALAQAEEHPGLLRLTTRRELALGFAALYGVGAAPNPKVAAERFNAAVERGAPPLADEARLWLASLMVERDWSASGLPGSAREALEDASATGAFLPRLLLARAVLARPATTAAQARAVWAPLADVDLCEAARRPVEVLAALECLRHLVRVGARPELAPFARLAGRFKPGQPGVARAQVDGAALLARAQLAGFGAHDAGRRAGLDRILGRLVAAARTTPDGWPGVAALIEVAQVQPIPPRTWREGWLQVFGAAPSSALDVVDPLRDALAWPNRLRLASLQDLPARVGADEQPAVRALLASLALRSTLDDAVASAAVDELLALAEGGSWHAAALLESFEARYHTAYARRQDHAGYRRDARRVLARLVDWRTVGHGCLPADREQAESAAARLALLGADDAALNPEAAALLTQHEDDATAMAVLMDALADSNVELDSSAVAGWQDTIIGRMSELSGRDVARAFADRNAARWPRLDWDLAKSIERGYLWPELGPQDALEHCRRAARAAASRPQVEDIARFAQLIAAAGDASDAALLAAWLAAPPPAPTRSIDEAAVRLELGDTVAADTFTAVAERCLAAAPVPDVELAQRYFLAAVRAGSEAAVQALTEGPAAVTPRALADVLLSTSTMNAPLALPRLQAAASLGDETAPALVADWVDAATGAPTARLARIVARRASYSRDPARVWVDTWDDPYLKESYGWLTCEQALLAKAAAGGDVDAQATLVRLGVRLPELAAVDPMAWIAQLSAALEADDVARLWRAVREAPTVCAEAARLWAPFKVEGLRAGVVLGRVGVRLLREPSAPSGVQRAQLDPLLARGVREGFGPALLGLVELRAGGAGSVEEASARVLEVCRDALTQEPANAPFLEAYLRDWCTDQAGWAALMREFGLLTPGSDGPTALSLALQEAVEFDRAARSTEAKAEVDVCFYRTEWDKRWGTTGMLLADGALYRRSARAIAALESLGYLRAEWRSLL